MFEEQRENIMKPLWIYHPKCAQAKLPKGMMLQVVRHGYEFAQTANIWVPDTTEEFKRGEKKLKKKKKDTCEFQALLLWITAAPSSSFLAFPEESQSVFQTAQPFLLSRVPKLPKIFCFDEIIVIRIQIGQT